MYFDHTATTPSTSSSSAHSQKNELMATSKWHTWAQEEAQHQKTDSHSPKIVHIRPPQVHAPPKPQPVTHVSIEPTPEQLQIVSFDPPQCFCKKEAHRGYTLEYGPILECASYGYTEQDTESYKRKYTCGFHVHEASWNKHCNDLKNGLTIQSDYAELRSCPLYNFTFCAVFFTSNQHDKVPPTVLPNCFCGNPVQLREGNHQLYFACKGFLSDGSKRCSWKLDAKEVAFTKPKHRLHTFVDLDTYHQHLDKLANPPTSPTFGPTSKSQHQNDLLASLCAPKANEAVPPTTHEAMSPMMSPIMSPTSLDRVLAPSTARNNTLVVPTSVLAKKQPTVSCSSSTSTVSTASSTTIQKAFHELEEAKILNATLRAALQRTKNDAQARIKEVETKLTKCVERVATIQNEYKDKTQIMQVELQQEFILRLSSQERLSSIEIDVVHLMNEKERVTDEFEAFKESTKTKYGKEEEFNKCKVCFHRSIEYVLLPCFHFGKCDFFNFNITLYLSYTCSILSIMCFET